MVKTIYLRKKKPKQMKCIFELLEMYFITYLYTLLRRRKMGNSLTRIQFNIPVASMEKTTVFIE